MRYQCTDMANGLTGYSTQRQERSFRIRVEFQNGIGVRAQQMFNLGGRAIAALNPNNLWWGAVQETKLMEVSVFRRNAKAVVHGEQPDGVVIGRFQADIAYM